MGLSSLSSARRSAGEVAVPSEAFTDGVVKGDHAPALLFLTRLVRCLAICIQGREKPRLRGHCGSRIYPPEV